MSLSADQEEKLVALVREVAKAEIMPRFRRLPDSDIRAKSAPDDLVTEADLRAEAAISDGVRALLPGAMVVGEEAVEADKSLLDHLADADLSVIIDPVDGTLNFAGGLATFGVILAVAAKGETIFGLLYDPVLDDWIVARKGDGTRYVRPDGTSQRLSLGGMPDGDATGCLPLFFFEKDARQTLAGDVPGFRRIWSVRCSCHEYRLMAGGKIDYTLSNPTLNPWDHAAGALAVQEAGGAVGLLDGRPYRVGDRVKGHLATARSPEMLEKVRAAFRPLLES